jgi:uncharacterized protein YukE
VFATSRRKRRSAMMKQELGQSVDHFKRAASIAAEQTSATVGPRISAAKDRVQPLAAGAAGKAKDTASSGWDTAVATLTPLVAAATENVKTVADNARSAGKQTSKKSKRAAKANQKKVQKNADKLQKRANQALGRKQGGRKASTLVGLALIGAAIGAGAAFVVRQRKAAQWDEYEPSRPIVPPAGADDAAFEPADTVVTPADGIVVTDTTIESPATTTKD